MGGMCYGHFMQKSSSKLAPFKKEILVLREQGQSLRAIADILQQRHGLQVSYNAIFSFLKNRPDNVLFYDGVPDDIREALLKQVTALWTYDSTAIEGNTLTLGETVKVLELGLTISGKSLKDHEEVYGHAKAIELIYELMNIDKISKEDLFNLHRCVMQKSAIDSLRPVGNWKQEHNGTTGIRDGKLIYMEYASPLDTPRLMTRWLKEFNRKLNNASSPAKAVNVYAWIHLSLVRIHPFFDGNGRIARLIANLPLLRGGQPPIIISLRRRAEYIDLLWNYQNAVGPLCANDPLLPKDPAVTPFKQLIRAEWAESVELVQAAKKQADQRTA